LAGAYPYSRGFYAAIGINYKWRYLGSFKTAEEAHARYLKELAALKGID